MSLIFKNLAFLLLLLYITGCKKNDPGSTGSITVPVEAKAIEVVSGNNQSGYLGKQLDPIVIKLTLNNPADSASYKYFFRANNQQDYLLVSNSQYSNGAIYLTVFWTPAQNSTSPSITFYSYAGCTSLQLGTPGGCKTLDSVKITATIRKPWVSIYTGPHGGYDVLWDLHFTDSNNGLALGEGTGVARTTDAGKTWTPSPPVRSDDDTQLMAFSSPDTGLVVTVNNYVMITTNGGKTFSQPAWTPPFVGDRSSSAYYMASRNLIYSVGGRGQIAKSIDGGLNWKQVGFSFLNNFSALTAVGKDTLYACGQVGKIAKSTDAGNTWQVQPIQLNNNLNCIYFVTDNFGFAGGQFGALIRTTDGGANWTIIKTGLGFSIIAIRFFTNTHGYIVTSGGEIAETMDGGVTWLMRNASNYGVGDLNKAVIKDETVVFGVQGASIYSYDLTQK